MNCAYGLRRGSRGSRQAEDQEDVVDNSDVGLGVKHEGHGSACIEHSAEHGYNQSGENWTVSEPACRDGIQSQRLRQKPKPKLDRILTDKSLQMDRATMEWFIEGADCVHKEDGCGRVACDSDTWQQRLHNSQRSVLAHYLPSSGFELLQRLCRIRSFINPTDNDRTGWKSDLGSKQ